MFLILLWQVILHALLVSAIAPTRTTTKRNNNGAPSKFVTTQDGQFMFNGSVLQFVGTNAYWLAALNSDEDIDFTLGNMSAKGIKVVRTWAFNDVESVPVNGTWFQLIANGTTTINTGPNGLQKLDTVVRLAEKHGLFIHLSLTNNWDPRPFLNKTTAISARDVTPGTNNTLPRNSLSNDYGGMDEYVREFGDHMMHDEFYTNPKILSEFMNYTNQIVSRYADNPTIFGWEIANDPRCNSSIPATSSCNTTTITNFHAVLAQHISSIDPNHLVSSGNQGFFCADCPKLFPRVIPSPPQTSPVANRRRANALKPLTKRNIIQERKAALMKTRKARKSNEREAGAIRIRGRWFSSATRRQAESPDDVGVGPAFDGSQGVDSEDILNIPEIGFGSFQLFPDQNTYGVDDPDLPAFNNTLNQGLDWIAKHAASGELFGKPVTLNGFGLVTQLNAPFFVPFNESVPRFVPDSGSGTTQPFGVTDDQRDDAYAQWLNAGLTSGLQGMFQYQERWSHANLTTAVGTAIDPTVSGTGVSPIVNGTGLSPNDGYAISGQGLDPVESTIQQASQQFGLDNPT
ncbi:hypothetical protein GALMADRAFT_224892 [Galerina marginata CBS 339.88]|uniref:mannan endo-1,4-beta-mannosidase n=1 Tax=Galerina marginata (strain CBS 339.88) TaxID=685588 RepID=A0A067TF42_GALM3|nr:hypothetical protein GALMADRAFT_224892 [Galerina marginata CBS 339.88]